MNRADELLRITLSPLSSGFLLQVWELIERTKDGGTWHLATETEVKLNPLVKP